MKPHATRWLTGFILISSSLLYGCGQDQKTTQIQNENHSHTQEVNDNDVTANVKTTLSNTAEFKHLKIAVVTTKGDVLLTGEVDNPHQLETITMLVQTIDGVHTVHNHLLTH